jgi:hypothetical protein
MPECWRGTTSRKAETVLRRGRAAPPKPEVYSTRGKEVSAMPYWQYLEFIKAATVVYTFIAKTVLSWYPLFF